jgi:hypothetical protein
MSAILQPAPGRDVLRGSLDAIIDQKDRFPATAAVAQQLKPYLDYANKHLTTDECAAEEAASKKFAVHEHAHLPPALAQEVRANMLTLQSNAFTAEAMGNDKLAAEIRAVNAELAGALEILRARAEMQQQTAAHANGHSHHAHAGSGNGNGKGVA